MFIGTYIQAIRSLMDQRRYQNLFLFKRRSVAEHSWSVAKICQSLAYLEERKFGHEVNMGLLLQLAVCHDELEHLTGDLLSNTKKRTPAMQKAVEEMEQVVFQEEYIKILPSGWEDDYRHFTLAAKDDSMEGKILTAADTIDALLEAIDEIDLGNVKHFKRVAKQQAMKLLTIDLDSVRYFLKNSMDDFGLDVQEYFGDEVYQTIRKLRSEG